MKNRALVFIKPHAMTERTIRFTEEFLDRHGLSVTARGVLTAERIDADAIVDRHYFAIASTAVVTSPASYTISDEAKRRFEDAFGESWDSALSAGKIKNAKELMEERSLESGRKLQALWETGTHTKLGPGFYAGKLKDIDRYVVNGFYPAMREKFTEAGGRVGWYAVEFEPSELSWKTFRGEVIGATDPTKAAAGSLRNELLGRWRELDQNTVPSVSDNGVHASAGPIEGLRELSVWTGAEPAEQELARELFERGMTRQALSALLENGPVTIREKTGPVFDLTEDIDADEAVGLLSAGK